MDGSMEGSMEGAAESVSSASSMATPSLGCEASIFFMFAAPATSCFEGVGTKGTSIGGTAAAPTLGSEDSVGSPASGAALFASASFTMATCFAPISRSSGEVAVDVADRGLGDNAGLAFNVP